MILLLLSLLAQDPDVLIEKLGSDSLDERDAATAQLLELGTGAIPKLEKALAVRGRERRSRIQMVLTKLQKRKRAGHFWPERKRVTVSLKDEPFASAVEKVLGPFGMSGIPAKDDLSGVRVTLDLQDAKMWEAMDALVAAAKTGVDWSRGSGGLSFGGRPEKVLGSDIGDVRIVVLRFHGELKLLVYLPPGALVSGFDFSDLKLEDERGRGIPFSIGDFRDETERVPARPSSVAVWEASIDESAWNDAKSLRVRGDLELFVPRDCETREIPIDRFEARKSVKSGTAEFSIDRWKINDEGNAEVGYGASAGGGEGVTALLAIEDAAGRWLADLEIIRLEASSVVSGTRTIVLPKGSSPARVAVWRLLDIETVRVAVDIRDIPVTPKSEDDR